MRSPKSKPSIAPNPACRCQTMTHDYKRNGTTTRGSRVTDGNRVVEHPREIGRAYGDHQKQRGREGQLHHRLVKPAAG